MNLKKLTRIILIVAVLLLLSIVPVNAVVFNAAFDSDFYVNCYPDLKAAFGNDANAAYNHYLTYGIKEGRIASPVFDAKTYLRNYPDLQAAFGDDYVAAYNHFLTNGMNEGRLASDSFNVQVYIANYPDLQAAFGNDVAGAYNHYLTNGMAEGRVCTLTGEATAPEDHVHDYTEFVEYTVQPTCQAKGEAIYKCSKCDETKTVEVDASEEYHNYVETEVVKPAGLNQMGISVYTCTICGDTDTRTTPAKECKHEEKYLTPYYTVPATCTKEGREVYTCSNCNKEVTKVLPKKEHISDTAEGKGYITVGAIKCTSDGAEEVKCKNCGETFTRPISAHEYETVEEIAATCTEPTKVVSKCKNCGETKTEVKVVDGVKAEALGHSFDTVIVKKPTCVTTGLSTKVCNVCSYTEKETLDALGHKRPDTVEYVAIDENGKVMKDSNNNEIIIANYQSGMTSCKYAIAERYTCGNKVPTADHGACNLGEKKIITKIADKRAHSIDATQPITTGIFECDDDGKLIINHNNDGKVVALTNATVDCTHARAQVFTCATCGTEQYNILEASTKHTKIAGTEGLVAPTCTTDGYTTYSCSSCHKTVKDQTLKELGHDYVYVPATCTEAGKVECTRCKGTVTTGTEFTKVLEAAYAKDKNSVIKNPNGTYAVKPAGTHDFTNSATKVVNGLTYAHCNNCDKDIEILPIKSVAKLTLAEGKANPLPNDEQIPFASNMEKITNVTFSGNTITVTASADLEQYTGGPGNLTHFALVLDLGTNKANVDAVKGYTFESSDKSSVGEWINNPSDNQFILWLNAEKTGNGCQQDGGRKITFKDTKTGISREITIKFVVAK